MTKRMILTTVLALAVTCGCRAWQLKPWQQTLIDIEVQRDTVPAPSLMLQGGQWMKTTHVDKRIFQCGPYWVPDPPSLFQAQDDMIRDERIRRGDYHTSDFVADFVSDLIDIFL